MVRRLTSRRPRRPFCSVPAWWSRRGPPRSTWPCCGWPVPRSTSTAEFSSLEPRAVGVTTVVSLLAGTAVLGLLQRRSRRPVRTFRALAVAVTVLSLGGPLFVATADPPDGPRFAAGATAPVLTVMHVVACAAEVGPLVALALPDDGRRR